MQNTENSLDRQLIAALKAQDVPLVESLLLQGADADARVGNERQPLFIAVESKNLELVRLIAPRVKDLDIQDSCDFTPFTTAVRMELPEIAHALLDCGASPFPIGKGSGYPLDWAVFRLQHGLVTRIISASPDCLYKDVPLMVYAAQQSDIGLAKACLAAGSSVNIGDDAGYTALHYAALGEDEAFIRLLISAGADENITDHSGRSAFDRARDASCAGILETVIMERDMRRAAREMTEGLSGDMTIRPPMQLKKTPGAQP